MVLPILVYSRELEIDRTEERSRELELAPTSLLQQEGNGTNIRKCGELNNPVGILEPFSPLI